ncbi:TPA: ComF family protein [Stenotrophomonas maltophilia]
MAVNVKAIHGNWDQGYALDKHTIKSEFIGNDDQGRPQFDTLRTDAGEAVFQLKYRGDERQAKRLAAAIHSHILSKFGDSIDIIVPMPASNIREVQPVPLVADELGKLTGIPVIHDFLLKKPNGISLKNLDGIQEKLNALKGTMHINDCLTGEGKINILLIDDLFHSGASMQVATQTLKAHKRIGKVLTAAMTWK